MGARLDLGARRGLGELISLTLATFRRHAALFLSVTFVVVMPVVVLVDGVWGRQLQDGAGAESPLGAGLASFALMVIVVPSLVTALQVAIVQALSRGERPGVRDAMGAAGERAGAAVAAVALYAVVVGLGLIALVVPGIWLAVRCYFAAQAAVVDGLRPAAALRASAELVRGSWWRVFGCLLTVNLAVGIPGALASLGLRELADSVGSGVLWVAGTLALQTVLLSLTALFGTLLFFDLRARREGPGDGDGVAPPAPPAQAPPAPAPSEWTHPEWAPPTPGDRST